MPGMTTLVLGGHLAVLIYRQDVGQLPLVVLLPQCGNSVFLFRIRRLQLSNFIDGRERQGILRFFYM
jgi:hypothetical protein